MCYLVVMGLAALGRNGTFHHESALIFRNAVGCLVDGLGFWIFFVERDIINNG